MPEYNNTSDIIYFGKITDGPDTGGLLFILRDL